MRDAVALEASGKTTAIVVNDVFAPIAYATATLLALPPNYVDENVVWLPHPTSNLSPDAVRALVDARIGQLRDALVGRLAGTAAPPAAAASPAALDVARESVAGLAASLEADGAQLVLLAFESGVLCGELRIGDVTCSDGSCIMPVDVLGTMIDALVRPNVAALREVQLRESGAAPS